MRVGDILEWLAAASLVTAAWLATSLAWPAVLVAGVFFAYQAQVYATHPLPRRKKP